MRINQLRLGIIPGPLQPKDINSFLEPMIEELMLLEKGVQCWEPQGYLGNNLPEKAGEFILRGGLCGITADMLGQAKLMCWTG